MPRKWIARRIAELDPAVDYDEIWKLSSCYRPNDFMMNLIYAVTFPHFLIQERESAPVHRNGTGKVYTQPDARADATSWKMQHWWYHGATAPETKKNVDALNRLHAHYAKDYPDAGFAHDDVYLYTLCYEAAGLHRLLQRVGLPGISEHEKLAAVEYWTRITPLFANVVTGRPLRGFPNTFDGIMQWMDRWEERSASELHNEQGRQITEAIIGQFTNKYFPKPLHSAVHAWIVSLYPDHMIKVYGLRRPGRLTVKAFRLLTATIFALGEKVIRDPVDTYTERRRAAARQARVQSGPGAPEVDPDEESLQFAAAAAGDASACPHLGLAAATTTDAGSVQPPFTTKG